MNRPDSNIQTLRKVFAAVEHRDQKLMLQLCTPDVEFHWPKSLPYGRKWVPWPAAARVGAKPGLRCSLTKPNGGSTRG